jgi:hypothetical protein
LFRAVPHPSLLNSIFFENFEYSSFSSRFTPFPAIFIFFKISKIFENLRNFKFLEKFRKI